MNLSLKMNTRIALLLACHTLQPAAAQNDGDSIYKDRQRYDTYLQSFYRS